MIRKWSGFAAPVFSSIETLTTSVILPMLSSSGPPVFPAGFPSLGTFASASASASPSLVVFTSLQMRASEKMIARGMV